MSLIFLPGISGDGTHYYLAMPDGHRTVLSTANDPWPIPVQPLHPLDEIVNAIGKDKFLAAMNLAALRDEGETT